MSQVHGGHKEVAPFEMTIFVVVYVVDNNHQFIVLPVLLVEAIVIQIDVFRIIENVCEASSQLIGLQLPITTVVHDLENLSQSRLLLVIEEQVSDQRQARLLQDNVLLVFLA